MKIIIRIILLLFSVNCFSQTNQNVLIVPMSSNRITFDRQVTKMINYNNVHIDSIKNYIRQLSIDLLKSKFPHYAFTNIQTIADYRYLVDSLDVLYQWNTFQIKKIKDSKGVEKIILANEDGPELKYFGRIISDKNADVFRTLVKEYDFSYIFFINKFEAVTRKPFDRETYICLHFEIYDQSLNKVFGGNSYYPTKISRKMYYDVFNYFIRKALDDFYEKINKFFH